MLPSKITRDILGVKRRRDFAESSTSQLVGRSRCERLLDGFYNRQSRELRKLEQKKLQRQLCVVLFSKRHGRPSPHPQAIKKPCKEEKNKSDTHDSKVKIYTSLEMDVIISNLTKHASNAKKLPKVIQLIAQLLHNSDLQTPRKPFFHLYCAVALNPCVTCLDPDHRSKVIDLGKLFSKSFHISPDCCTEKVPLSCQDNSHHVCQFLNESPSLTHWLAILHLPVIWHNSLYTDDTYQFHQALSHFNDALQTLPPITTYVYHPTTISFQYLVSLFLQDQSMSDIPESPSSHSQPPLLTADAPTPHDKDPPEHQCDTTDNADDDSPYLPSRHIAYSLQRQFITAALPTLFEFSKTRWCRSGVSQFFQSLYLEREQKFTNEEVIRIEDWQAQIRRLHLEASSLHMEGRPPVLGEAQHPVQDGRDQRIIAVHGAAVWSSKQAGI